MLSGSLAIRIKPKPPPTQTKCSRTMVMYADKLYPCTLKYIEIEIPIFKYIDT